MTMGDNRQRQLFTQIRASMYALTTTTTTTGITSSNAVCVWHDKIRNKLIWNLLPKKSRDCLRVVQIISSLHSQRISHHTMTEILQFFQKPGLSTAELHRLVKKLQTVTKHVKSVQTEFCFYVNCQGNCRLWFCPTLIFDCSQANRSRVGESDLAFDSGFRNQTVNKRVYFEIQRFERCFGCRNWPKAELQHPTVDKCSLHLLQHWTQWQSDPNREEYHLFGWASSKWLLRQRDVYFNPWL